MDAFDQIHLRDFVQSVDIGAFQSERGAPQRLRFDLTVDLAEARTGIGDDVDMILSYDVLTDAIAAGLADRRFNLLETLAEKIAAEILAHPRADMVRVTVEKLDRVAGALGVTLSRRRGRVAADGISVSPAVVLWGADVATPSGAVVIVPDAQGEAAESGPLGRRLALLSLDRAAWILGERLGLDVVDNRTEMDWAIKESRPIIWAPARMAADTSDISPAPLALAQWLAGRVGAKRLDLALPAHAAMPEVTALETRRIT